MISKEQVKHIAKLARLELAEKETEKMQKDLSEILDYFNLLKTVKKPKTKVRISQTLAKTATNVTRKDVAAPYSSTLANNLVALAPAKQDDYIKVKSIL